jgi:ABC-type nitrate/sulfonate/bicarbonate transport system permease component
MVATTAPPTGRRWMPSWLSSVIGVVALVAIWQLVGSTMFREAGSVPTPSKVISQLVDDPSFYWRNLSTTMKAAAQGWLWGNVLAIGLALLVLVVPLVERPVIQIGVVSYCLPIVAIGPIFTIVFDGQTPKVVLAAMSVFFTTLIGALVGLRSADPTTLDVIHAYGGNSVHKLAKVRFRAGLPSLFAGLRVAAPAAVLGAIIGEYFGADRGVGVAMIAAQQRLDAPTTWALALIATAAAGLTYAATALVGRLLTPWAPRNVT